MKVVAGELNWCKVVSENSNATSGSLTDLANLLLKKFDSAKDVSEVIVYDEEDFGDLAILKVSQSF